MSTKGPYDFETRERIYRRYSLEELEYAANDAREARDLASDPVCEAWYQDDVLTILTEINRRKRRTKAS